MASVSRAALITGCSTGIGRATAERLANRGLIVYASARRLESIADLEPLGCRLLRLDTTDDASMVDAVRAIAAAEGAVGALVNNAGYAEYGAMETVDIDRFRRQFETNVFGAVRLTQLVLPGMRRQKWGRIVNVGSMAGRLVYPAGGAYHMSKHAMEAMSDSFRFETRGFGVRVSHIQPGFIVTKWGETALETIPEGVPPEYRELHQKVTVNFANAYSGQLSRLARGPEAVASVIEHAITSKRPRTRYRVPPSATAMLALRRVLPDPAFDFLLRRWYPTPK